MIHPKSYVYDQLGSKPRGNLYYLKYEADKVIADKDAKILALDAEVLKQRQHAQLFFDERNYAEAQLRRYRHKHCLDMAYKCMVLCQEHCLNMAYKCMALCQESKNRYHGADYENLEYQYVRKIEFYHKWHRRWRKLAERFKEG